MKTPREILLERHRTVETKLDAIRQNVVATAVPHPRRSGKSEFSAGHVALALWRELVLPCRAIWTSVAAVWLVIIALHLSTGSSPKSAPGQMAASVPDALTVLREEKQILAELLGPNSPSLSPAIRPEVPGPRGDLRETIRLA